MIPFLDEQLSCMYVCAYVHVRPHMSTKLHMHKGHMHTMGVYIDCIDRVLAPAVEQLSVLAMYSHAELRRNHSTGLQRH